MKAKELLGLLCALAVIVIAYYVDAPAIFHQSASEQPAGATLPSGAAVFETSLASRISTSDTSMTLAANSVRGGSTLSGYQCFTIDEGRTDAEYVCGTVSGTSVTSLERGVDPLTGTTTNATVKFAHRVGANVKITDFPLIARLKAQNDGTDTHANILWYTYSPNFTGAASSSIPSKGYVDGVAIAGASDANDTTKGIVEMATAAEAAAGTSLGGTGARLVVGTNITSSTCSGSIIPVTTSGKIAQGCLDLTTTYSWTGLHTFSGGLTSTGTTTISASSLTTNPLKLNGLAYTWQTARAASSTVPSENGSGALTFNTVSSLGAGAFIVASTTNTTLSGNGSTTYGAGTLATIPAGLLSTNGALEIWVYYTTLTDSSAQAKPTTLITLGGTTVCTIAGNTVMPASGSGGVVHAIITATSTASQNCVGTFDVWTSGTAVAHDYGETFSTVNTATAQALGITIQNDSAGGGTKTMTVGSVTATFLGHQ